MSKAVSFDDDVNDFSLSPLQAPSLSSHWLALNHRDGDRMIRHMEELKAAFISDLTNNDNRGETLALWSCVFGYSEALATHKLQRYHIFPIPFGALQRLIHEEFVPRVNSVSVESSNPTHRSIVQALSNMVWTNALSKPNVRDEVHANSVYVWLRGILDRKSLDCFGAALTTIAGSLIKGLNSSQLVLSEDHAYERHVEDETTTPPTLGTCEVAIPGTTKAVQGKRGREIAATFSSDAILTPETSWLYMASNPVVCDSLPMTLVAVVGNINCTIQKPLPLHKKSLASGQLYDMKRDLLWILYDQGHMDKFPFGLMELGDCEENRGSCRSAEWVEVDYVPEPILLNEKLFLDAIHINKTIYNESQVYPYFYAGHYHKDAGNEGPDHEYRLVHAMKNYADAARIASKYRYEGTDSLQLNKHMSSAALLIAHDILTPKHKVGGVSESPRQWIKPENALATGTWLLGFFDSLLYWEESASDGKHFVEILTPTHKYGIGKLFQLFNEETQEEILKTLSSTPEERTQGEEEEKETTGMIPTPFSQVRSKRLSSGSLLLQALQKPKISIGELELAIPSTGHEGGGRRSKRIRT